MEYKTISGIKIPVLGLGTWHMGGGMSADYSNDEKYIEAIRYTISKGITHIDTAEIYSAGHAEELVGEAIKKFVRKKLFITTKISPHHIFLPSQIVKSCENSLKRLQTDYIDLYLIHWPNPLAPMKKVMSTFDQLVKNGKIKNIGVSNFSVHQFQNAQKYTKHKIVCNQVRYSLADRSVENGLLQFCGKEDIILTAYTPLESGMFAKDRSDALEAIAKKYKKTKIQVALRYLIEKPNVITIPKASSKPHIDELLGAVGWKMSKADQECLSKSF